MCFGAALRADVPQPAELPPRDFTGAQYIDSAGCVFLRDGRAWVAALTEDGAQICGFPPSQTVWAGRDAVGSAPRNEAAIIERELLMRTVTAAGVRVAVDDNASPATLPAPPSGAAGGTAPSDPVKEGGGGIGAEIARGLALRQQIGLRAPSYLQSDDRLCALLGLQPAGVDPVLIGDDPTGGLCSGHATKISTARTGKAMPAMTVAKVAGKDAQRHAAGPGTAGEQASGARHAGAGERAGPRPVAAEAVGTHLAGTGPEQARPTAAQAVGHDTAKDGADVAAQGSRVVHELIGPRARFVQIGRFDAAGAEIAAKALSGLGYRVVRETRVDSDGRRYVMAGPFTTRAELVAALDDIRKAGYGRAVAR